MLRPELVDGRKKLDFRNTDVVKKLLEVPVRKLGIQFVNQLHTFITRDVLISYLLRSVVASSTKTKFNQRREVVEWINFVIDTRILGI
jgi:hypothetical protein